MCVFIYINDVSVSRWKSLIVFLVCFKALWSSKNLFYCRWALMDCSLGVWIMKIKASVWRPKLWKWCGMAVPKILVCTNLWTNVNYNLEKRVKMIILRLYKNINYINKQLVFLFSLCSYNLSKNFKHWQAFTQAWFIGYVLWANEKTILIFFKRLQRFLIDTDRG